MRYQVLAKYKTTDEFGEWQVATFGYKKYAVKYAKETVERYRQLYKYFEFDMRVQKLSDTAANKFDSKLQTIFE